MTKQYGIFVSGHDHKGTWMSDSWSQKSNGDWYANPALYTTMTEAKADARLFQKDSKYDYVAKIYK